MGEQRYIYTPSLAQKEGNLELWFLALTLRELKMPVTLGVDLLLVHATNRHRQ